MSINESDIDQEIKDTKTMITNHFADYRHLAYRLYAVFIHHGSVEFGHYYIYIYDFKKDIWRKYNDNDITEVTDLAEIFQEANDPNPPTPYFLVYVNDLMKDRLVNPVCREVFDPFSNMDEDNHHRQTESDADTVMKDATDTQKATGSGNVTMDPPTYDEAWAQSGSGVSGTGANLPPSSMAQETKNGIGTGGWAINNNQTNIGGAQW